MIAGPECDAVRRGKFLWIDHGGRRFKVEPHICGLDRKGEALMWAWIPEPGPATSSGRWSLLRLDEIANPVVSPDNSLAPRPGYDGAHPAIVLVACKVGIKPGV